VGCSPCQHATRKPVKTGKHRPDLTVQPRVAVLMKRQYRAALMVSSGIWCHEGVRWNAFKQCILSLPNTTVSVSPALGQQPTATTSDCILTSRHWMPYFLSLSDQKIVRVQVYLPYVRLPAVKSRPVKRILTITQSLKEIYQHYNFAKTQQVTLRNYWSCLEQCGYWSEIGRGLACSRQENTLILRLSIHLCIYSRTYLPTYLCVARSPSCHLGLSSNPKVSPPQPLTHPPPHPFD
jgi:hypothetical protein